jgi:hypothetical protein
MTGNENVASSLSYEQDETAATNSNLAKSSAVSLTVILSQSKEHYIIKKVYIEDVLLKNVLIIYSSSHFLWSKAANLIIIYSHSMMELIVRLDVMELPLMADLARGQLQRLRDKPVVAKRSFVYICVQPCSYQQR